MEFVANLTNQFIDSIIFTSDCGKYGIRAIKVGEGNNSYFRYYSLTRDLEFSGFKNISYPRKSHNTIRKATEECENDQYKRFLNTI